MKQVFYLADGTVREVGALQVIKSVVAEIAKIDVINPIVSEVAYKGRLATCDTCPKFVPDTKQCMQCGCYMEAKAKIRTAECPLGKWNTNV